MRGFKQILAALLVLVGLAQSADKTIDLWWAVFNYPVDSVDLMIYDETGASSLKDSADAARTATPQTYDTSIILTDYDTKLWQAHFRIFYTALADSTIKYRPWTVPLSLLVTTTATGGDHQVRIFAIDTSGTDEPVPGVKLTIRDVALSATAIDVQYTGAGGFYDFSLDADSYAVLGTLTGYSFQTDTVVVAGPQTDSIEGYNQDLQADLCLTTVTVADIGGQPIERARVDISLAMQGNAGVQNECTGEIVLRPDTSAWTDATGQAQFYLIRSACLSVPSMYKFEIAKRRYGPAIVFYDSIPNTTTHTVQVQAWGS